jgi:hypothetical protein
LPLTSGEEFTVLEEIELLTVDIRGYASQIQVAGRIENRQQAIERLHCIRVTDIPIIAQFYLEANDDYPQMKAYIRILNYMRSLILEYLLNSQAPPHIFDFTISKSILAAII